MREDLRRFLLRSAVVVAVPALWAWCLHVVSQRSTDWLRVQRPDDPQLGFAEVGAAAPILAGVVVVVVAVAAVLLDVRAHLRRSYREERPVPRRRTGVTVGALLSLSTWWVLSDAVSPWGVTEPGATHSPLLLLAVALGPGLVLVTLAGLRSRR